MLIEFIVGLLIGIAFMRIANALEDRVDNGRLWAFGITVILLLVVGGSSALVGWVVGLFVDAYVIERWN